MTRPAALNRATNVVSATSILPASFSATLPFVRVWPAKLVYKSLSRNGTPRNGPSGRAAGSAATDRAWSNHSMTTAFTAGFDCSIRWIAASNSSLGVTSPLATSAAWSVASIHRVSSARLLMAPGCTTPLASLAGVGHPGSLIPDDWTSGRSARAPPLFERSGNRDPLEVNRLIAQGPGHIHVFLRRTSASRSCGLFWDKVGMPPTDRRHGIASPQAICPSKPSVLAMLR